METIIFFKWLGLTTLSLSLILGAGYWIRVIINKIFPDWKFWLKYKLLKRKFNEDVMTFLSEDLENGVDAEEMFKTILMGGYATPNQAGELRYIYKELQRRYEK